jgi:hypothetical protein
MTMSLPGATRTSSLLMAPVSNRELVGSRLGLG